MIYTGKRLASAGLKKPHTQIRDLDNILRWILLMGGGQVAGGGWPKMGKMGRCFYPNFIQPLLEYFDGITVTVEAGSFYSSKRPTLSFGRGSYLGVSCRDAL